jgi:hypothetical protein
MLVMVSPGVEAGARSSNVVEACDRSEGEGRAPVV